MSRPRANKINTLEPVNGYPLELGYHYRDDNPLFWWDYERRAGIYENKPAQTVGDWIRGWNFTLKGKPFYNLVALEQSLLLQKFLQEYLNSNDEEKSIVAKEFCQEIGVTVNDADKTVTADNLIEKVRAKYANKNNDLIWPQKNTNARTWNKLTERIHRINAVMATQNDELVPFLQDLWRKYLFNNLPPHQQDAYINAFMAFAHQTGFMQCMSQNYCAFLTKKHTQGTENKDLSEKTAPVERYTFMKNEKQVDFSVDATTDNVIVKEVAFVKELFDNNKESSIISSEQPFMSMETEHTLSFESDVQFPNELITSLNGKGKNGIVFPYQNDKKHNYEVNIEMTRFTFKIADDKAMQIFFPKQFALIQYALNYIKHGHDKELTAAILDEFPEIKKVGTAKPSHSSWFMGKAEEHKTSDKILFYLGLKCPDFANYLVDNVNKYTHNEQEFVFFMKLLCRLGNPATFADISNKRGQQELALQLLKYLYQLAGVDFADKKLTYANLREDNLKSAFHELRKHKVFEKLSTLVVDNQMTRLSKGLKLTIPTDKLDAAVNNALDKYIANVKSNFNVSKSLLTTFGASSEAQRGLYRANYYLSMLKELKSDLSKKILIYCILENTSSKDLRRSLRDNIFPVTKENLKENIIEELTKLNVKFSDIETTIIKNTNSEANSGRAYTNAQITMAANKFHVVEVRQNDLGNAAQRSAP